VCLLCWGTPAADLTKRKEANKMELDGRVDENTALRFGDIGYDVEELPDSLVEVYKKAKARQDRVRPAMLSQEMIIVCSLISDLKEQIILNEYSSRKPGRPKKDNSNG